MFVVAKWLVDQDATWYEGRRRPNHIVLDGAQLPPKQRGHSPQFSAQSKEDISDCKDLRYVAMATKFWSN